MRDFSSLLFLLFLFPSYVFSLSSLLLLLLALSPPSSPCSLLLLLLLLLSSPPLFIVSHFPSFFFLSFVCPLFFLLVIILSLAVLLLLLFVTAFSCCPPPSHCFSPFSFFSDPLLSSFSLLLFLFIYYLLPSLVPWVSYSSFLCSHYLLIQLFISLILCTPISPLLLSIPPSLCLYLYSFGIL